MRPDVNHYDPAYNDSSIDWDKEEKKDLSEAKAEIERLKTGNARLQARVKVLEEAVTEALVAAKAEWNLVLRHPASRFAGDVAYYESVLYPQAREMLGEDKP